MVMKVPEGTAQTYRGTVEVTDGVLGPITFYSDVHSWEPDALLDEEYFNALPQDASPLLPKYPYPETSVADLGRVRRVAIGIGYTTLSLFGIHAIDQNILAPIVWGAEAAETRQVLATEYDDSNLESAVNILVFTGTGSRDPTEGVIIPLAPAFETIENSKVFAMREGSTIFWDNTEAAVDAMIATSPAQNLILYGSSVGGKQALRIANYVSEKYPHLHLLGVILDSSPDDAETAYALRSHATQKFASFVERAKLSGGPIERSLIDLFIMSNDKYISANGFDVEAFKNETRRIGKDVWGNIRSSNQLYLDQVSMTIADTAADDISEIAEHVEENEALARRTTISYLAPIYDRVVDSNMARNEYRDMATDSGLNFSSFSVNTGHADTRTSPDAYIPIVTAALKDIMGNMQAPRSNTPDVPPVLAFSGDVTANEAVESQPYVFNKSKFQSTK